MIRAAVILLAMQAVLVSAAESQEALYTLVSAEQTARVDGILDEAFWSKAQAVTFVRYPNGEDPKYPTVVRAATDGDWLFVVYEVTDPSPKPADGVEYAVDTLLTGADDVELFLDPGTGGRLYYQFAADRFGQQYEKRMVLNTWTRRYEADMHWNGHWRAAGKESEDGWIVEMAVPLCHFQADRGVGDAAWRINFCRQEKNLEADFREWTQWARTKDTFHDPLNFGFLKNVPDSPSADMFLPSLQGVRVGIISDAEGLNAYPVLIGVANPAKRGGRVDLVVNDNAPGGGRKDVKDTLLIGAGEQRVVRVPMTNPGRVNAVDPDPVVTLTYRDDMGTWRVTMVNLMGRIEQEEDRVLDAYVERSYYTSESEAAVQYEIDAPPEQRASLRLQVKVIGQEPETEWFRAQPRELSSAEGAVQIPLSEMPDGRHLVQAQLLQGEDVRERLDLELVKRPPLQEGNEVKVDRYHRCLLVNGKPFFPYGCARLFGDIKPYADIGFNVVLQWGGNYQYDKLLAEGKTAREMVWENDIRKAAVENNILIADRVMMQYIGLGGNKRFRRVRSRTKGEPAHDLINHWFEIIRALSPEIKRHPASFATMMFDEPNDLYLGDIPWSQLSRDMFQAVDKADGYHPVFNNFGGPPPEDERWTGPCDFISWYTYWGGGRPDQGRKIAFGAMLADRRVAPLHKPVVLMPTIGDNMSVPLIPCEHRANLYLMMIHGARGLWHFTWPAMHIATRNVLEELAGEIHTLAPALLHRRPAQIVRAQGADARERMLDGCLLRDPEGGAVLMFANRTETEVTVEYDLPWDNARLVPVFGKTDALDLVNGKARETFAPLATRAYRASGVTIPERQRDPYLVQWSETGPKDELRRVLELTCDSLESWSIGENDEEYVTLTKEKPEQGAAAIQLRRPNRELFINALSRPFVLEAGHDYRLEAWVRHIQEAGPEARHGGALVMINMPRGSRNKYVCGGTSKTTRDWMRVERTFHIVESVTNRVELRLNRGIGTASFDHIVVTDLGRVQAKTTESRNLVPNSSFEFARLPLWPDRWRMSDYTDYSRGVLGTRNAPWGMVKTSPWEGDHCLQMIPERCWGTFSWYQRWNAGVAVKDGKHYVLSVYIRANADNLPVTLYLRDIGEKDVRVGTEWKRYTFSGLFRETASNNSTTAIRFIAKSGGPDVRVWFDAVQLEQGTEPTTYVDDGWRPAYRSLQNAGKWMAEIGPQGHER